MRGQEPYLGILGLRSGVCAGAWAGTSFGLSPGLRDAGCDLSSKCDPHAGSSRISRPSSLLISAGLVAPSWPLAAVIVRSRWHDDPPVGPGVFLGHRLVEIHVGRGIWQTVATWSSPPASPVLPRKWRYVMIPSCAE